MTGAARRASWAIDKKNVAELRSPATDEYQLPLIRCSALGLMLLMASFIPLRYPRPYPITQAATAQAAINSQVRPLGMVHAMCTVAPPGRSHQFG